MPEIPKKRVPEQRRPVPQKEEEAPPPKGIVLLSFGEPSSCTIRFPGKLLTFMVSAHSWCMYVCCAGLQGGNSQVLKVPTVSKVPAVPKKPVPEEKVPVPVPVAKKPPPPRGRICLRPLSSLLASQFFPIWSVLFLPSPFVLLLVQLCVNYTCELLLVFPSCFAKVLPCANLF